MQMFTGKEYLEIDIASNYGLDKKSWKERLDWFQGNYDTIDALYRTAENPALFYAGVQAYRAMERGEPIGYTISLDATSSGLQLLAALTGDRSAAELCNVVDTGIRRDAYTDIFEYMIDVLMKRFGENAGNISRDDCKAAIMTSLYGSKAEPKRIFGEGSKQLQIFYETMKTLAPGAWELNEAFLSIWDPTVLSNDWVLPDNFHVHVKVMGTVTETVQFMNQPYEINRRVNMPVEEGRSLGANVIHSIDGMIVREMVRRCDYDPKAIARVKYAIEHYNTQNTHKQTSLRSADYLLITLWDHYNKTGYLSARILDYITEENIGLLKIEVIEELINSLPKKPFKVISIHDCFRCHPNYGNDLRTQYVRQLYEIGKSNLLSNLLSQLVHRNVNVSKLDPNMHADILGAEYALS